MLNGYAFSKRLQEYKQLDTDQNKDQRFKLKHVNSRDNLALNYKHRVDKFIQDMSIEPVMITNYKPKESNFRLKEDRSKMLGDALIRTKSFVTEKVRIQQSIEHYKNLLDTEGSVNTKMVPDFRERDVSKEIQPKMRFTASTQLERVIDAISQNRNSMGTDNAKDQIKKQTITDMILNSVKNNLVGSHQKHQNEKLINRHASQEPTRDSNGISMLDQSRRNKNDQSQSGILNINQTNADGVLTQNPKLKGLYSTTSSSRLRMVTSQYMTQNHVIARYINKEYRKMHFKAAQTVSVHAPGVLSSPQNNKNNSSNSPNASQNQTLRSPKSNLKNESVDQMHFINGIASKTQQSFLTRQKINQAGMLNTSKSAFFLPITKPNRNTQDSILNGGDMSTPQNHFSKTNIGFYNPAQTSNFSNFNKTQSNFQLPQVRNPILISKEKQEDMSNYLELKSQNPYQVKKRKHTSHSQNERKKIDQLMRASYTDSSFYNMYYRNSTINDPKTGGAGINQQNVQNKKQLRFANDTGDQDDSNFGLDMPSLDDLGSENGTMRGTAQGFKGIGKKGGPAAIGLKLQKDNNPQNITNQSQIEGIASDVLVNCNAVVNKNNFTEKMLKKGQGKLTAGSGKTNIQIYQQLLQTF
eukprot:403333690